MTATDHQRRANDIAAEYKEFSYRVSHDLSAPARAMVEFAKLLNADTESGLSEENREYLSIIVDSGKKLQAMMDGLLAFSRINDALYRHVSVDLGKLTKEICEAQTKGRNVQWVIGTLPVVLADPDVLKKILTILIDNARTYQPHGQAPRIELSGMQTVEGFQVTVGDNGIGIDPRYHERIFGVFQRLHRDDEYSGIGMGLATARKMSERCGGRLWVESQLEEGAFFHLMLPAEGARYD